MLWPLGFVLGLWIGLGVSFAVERAQSVGRVARGVVLHEGTETTPLGGIDAQALEGLLQARSRALGARSLRVTVEEHAFSSTLADLGVSLNLRALTEAALKEGRAGALPSQFAWWLARLFTSVPLDVEPELDAERFDGRLAEWEKTALPQSTEMPAISFEGAPRAHYGAPRRAIDRTQARATLEGALRARRFPESLVVPVLTEEPPVSREEVDARLAEAQALLAGPVTLVSDDETEQVRFEPATLRPALSTEIDPGSPPRFELSLAVDKLSGLAALRTRIERPAQPAKFTFDAKHRVSITPSAPGLRLDESALREALFSAARHPERRGRLPLVEEKPSLTTEEAEQLNVRGLVAQFTTRHPCCEARVKNIHFAASQADGIVLRPGETFSLNQLLGPRTNESGFLDAPAIVRGKMKETPGGGISQFATTLFNAVLDGGYEILQRQPHTYYFPRYPEGHEATVSYPVPDLVFRNDTRSGLVIKTLYDATSIRVLLYGDNEGRRVERRLSKRFDIVEPPVEYEPNDRLDPEKSKRLTAGQVGWSVIATRVIHYPDGRSVEQSRRVTYNPRPEVVEVHPCKIPKGHRGYTGEPCPLPPEPEEPEDEEAAPDDAGSSSAVAGDTDPQAALP